MTVLEAQRQAAARLEQAGVVSYRYEAGLIVAHGLRLSKSELVFEASRVLSHAEQVRLERDVQRRCTREPLQHILGTAPFYGLELNVTPDALIPRPETERLVEMGLERLRGVTSPKVLDVGTGSGAIALAIKTERPDAQLLASDVSPQALALASSNAALHGLDVSFVCAHLLTHPALRAFAQQLDLLLSNLPYLPEADRLEVSPEVRHDPALALYSGADGLAHFRQLESQARALLPEGATALLELDPRNVEQAFKQSSSWSWRQIHPDLTGRQRFIELKR